MLRPSHYSPFDHSNNILSAVQIMKILTVKFPPLPSYFFPFRPKYLPQHPVLENSAPILTVLIACILTELNFSLMTPKSAPRYKPIVLYRSYMLLVLLIVVKSQWQACDPEQTFLTGYILRKKDIKSWITLFVQ
jgi:hypothetical protein